MLEILLNQLGFSDKQTNIYLLLLEHGAMTPAEIAERAKINRSTVYAVVEDLLIKGVIREDLMATTKKLIALPPHNLQRLAQRDEKELELKKARINSAITELEKVVKTDYVVPKMNFIPDEEIEVFMRERADEWDRSIVEHDGIWWGFQDGTFVEQYADWIDWYWSRADGGLSLRLLSNETPKEREIRDNYERRQLKYLEAEHDFTSTTWVNGDYVVVVQTAVKPFYLFEIKDRELGKNLRFLFKRLWGE